MLLYILYCITAIDKRWKDFTPTNHCVILKLNADFACRRNVTFHLAERIGNHEPNRSLLTYSEKKWPGSIYQRVKQR